MRLLLLPLTFTLTLTLTLAAASSSSSSTPLHPPHPNHTPHSHHIRRISSSSTSTSTSTESLIFSEDWSHGIDFSLWKHEITLSGGGNWEFQYYTNNRSNSFVEDGVLHILPTETADRLGAAAVSGQIPTTFEIWGSQPADECTSNAFWGCSRSSGGTNVINPVQSARLRTANTFSFKYGRLEVEAKLPKGDWIWPAIWLLPEDQAYGLWPASGEIDLMESRGNDASYPAGGVNCFASTLHFGPYFPADPYISQQHCLEGGATFNDDFHIFGLVWNEKEIYTYLDDESNRVFNLPMDVSFWERGGWNSSTLSNPWRGQPVNAPFDQRFYLILNVAVGGTNGYFPDGMGGKPWSDSSSTAYLDFYNAMPTVTQTWSDKDSSLQIKSVKVWQ